ncbi:MAG: Na+/H+ antiporter NhaA [Acidimicrobiales bacterium]|nr:Na+/H+ antiporter NhaA [Acidimicrobiales bacterium]
MAAHNNLPIRDEAFSGSDHALARGVVRPVATFLGRETAAGILLIIATAAALIWANVDYETYSDFWHTEIALEIGDFRLYEDLSHWVNDALMALFFFVVGMEIKSELVLGDLRNPKIAALPAIGALGGMVVPAAFYFVFNTSGAAADGWGIPMATDIAFAVGVLALVGHKVPKQLPLFLLTLAIVDDIGAIVVIAVFYNDGGLSFGWLGWAVAGLLAVVVMQRIRIWFTPLYVVIGCFVWFATFESGVHATIAGVALGMLTPAKPLIGDQALGHLFSSEHFETEGFGPRIARDAQFQIRERVGVTTRLIALLSPFTSYVIIPVFALANAGILLSTDVITDALASSVTIGIIFGLVVGKPLGIYVFSVFAIRSGLATLPRSLKQVHILAAGAVAGIGFTVALFINGLAFEDEALIKDQATIGVLLASLLATLLGYGIIRFSHVSDDATPEGDRMAEMVDTDGDGRPDPVPVGS